MTSRKTICLYHSDQVITNFCKDRNCLMPLCPSCIGEHSSFHEKNGSKPLYSSIYEIICQVQNLVYDSISALQFDKKRTIQLTRRINSIADIVRQKILHAKQLVHNILEDAFLQLQNDIKGNLAKMHDQIGLHSSKKTEKMAENIQQNLTQLYSLNQGLTSEKYLGYLILFLKEKQKDSQAFHSKVASYLQSNENYAPKMDINHEAVNSIVNSITRIIKIQGKKEFQKKRQLQNHQKISILKNRQNNKDYFQKNEKIQRSYTPKRSSNIIKPIPEASKSQRYPLITSNSAYLAGINSPQLAYTPSIANIPLQREKTLQDLQKRYSPLHQPLPTHLTSNYSQTSRFREFKHQFDNLSKRISQMQRQNQLTAKAKK